MATSTSTQADRDRAHFEEWASRYDRSVLQMFLFGPSHRVTLDVARQAAPQARDILDVGCGTGNLLQGARRSWPDAHLAGVDPAPNMIAVARGKHEGDAMFRFEVGDSARLPFGESSFDLAFTTWSFHHWADQPGGVREVARVLRPGGFFVLADHTALVLLRPFARRFPSPRARRELFGQAGLSVVSQRGPLRLLGNLLVTVGEKRS